MIIYYQAGIKLATKRMGDGSVRPIPVASERFYPVTQCQDSQPIAEWLVEHCGAPKALLTAMAETMAIAEIGGYWFFADGSELPINN